MNLIFSLLIIVFSISSHAAEPYDLPVDLTGAELREVYANSRIHPRVNTPLDPVLRIGERNLDWLKYLNAHRPADQYIDLYSKSSMGNIPITAPKFSSVAIIQKMYADLLVGLPSEMKSVLVDGAAFTESLPVAIDVYLKWAIKVDIAYQNAVRWNFMQPYLNQLEQRRRLDVRGYYYLSHLTDLDNKLINFKSLPVAEQNQIREALIQMCTNGLEGKQNCSTSVDGLILIDKVPTAYKVYSKRSKAVYDSFFTIDQNHRRSDVTFSDPNTLSIPFIKPADTEVQNFLISNIEDEWKLGTFQLKLNWVAAGDHAHIVFAPGIVPHVDSLGGSEISMDSNEPLSAYLAQWTIRHEFGHVLGFSDCYLEFYQAETQEIVSYQLDVDNLMCARTGHLQQIHIDQLIQSYK